MNAYEGENSVNFAKQRRSALDKIMIPPLVSKVNNPPILLISLPSRLFRSEAAPVPVWRLMPDHKSWIVLTGASLAWLAVSVLIGGDSKTGIASDVTGSGLRKSH